MSSPGGRGVGSRRWGRLRDLVTLLAFGWVRGASRRLARAGANAPTRTKAERALAVLPQLREGAEPSRWATPPRMPEAIAWREVLTIAVLTLTTYTIGVMFAYLEWRLTAAPNLHPAIPSVIGERRINLLIQPMFEVETGAYQESARDAERLESYGWADRDAGTIHVPVLRAMDDLLTAGDAGAPSVSPP